MHPQPVPPADELPGRSDAAVGVMIIGAGFAGIAMAIGLLRSGRRDFVLLEKAADIGGTWRDNTYPGCGCDVPSQLYSYSFAPQAAWSHTYAPQSEILAYLRRVAARFDVMRHVRCGAGVAALDWIGPHGPWRVTLTDGRVTFARVVVSAVGGIHVPKMPEIAGLAAFEGDVFHTARWRHDVDLAGRSVAVIGTGASAVQVVPAIAPQVARLHVFQRTPSWILPRRGGPTTAWGRWTTASIPGVRWLRRAAAFWRAETTALGFVVKPKLVERGQKRAIQFLKRSIPDPALVKQLWPGYALGCKRVLVSDDFYPTLRRDNVELVTERIERFGTRGIITADGRERTVDVVVMATGFKPFDVSAQLDVRGSGGLALREAWQDGPRAFQGIAVAGFPNLFLLMGPNTALGHTSVVFMIEAQVRTVLRCLRWMASVPTHTLAVKPEVQAAFNRRLDERFERTVWRSTTWQSGKGWTYRPCGSWYRHATGRNHVIWPGSASAYWLAMQRITPADFTTSTEPLTLPITARAATPERPAAA